MYYYDIFNKLENDFENIMTSEDNFETMKECMDDAERQIDKLMESNKNV